MACSWDSPINPANSEEEEGSRGGDHRGSSLRAGTGGAAPDLFLSMSYRFCWGAQLRYGTGAEAAAPRPEETRQVGWKEAADQQEACFALSHCGWAF